MPKRFFTVKKYSDYKINIDIKSIQLKKNIVEIETTLALNQIKNDVE